jgi:hypothetical protein
VQSQKAVHCTLCRGSAEVAKLLILRMPFAPIINNLRAALLIPQLAQVPYFDCVRSLSTVSSSYSIFLSFSFLIRKVQSAPAFPREGRSNWKLLPRTVQATVLGRLTRLH